MYLMPTAMRVECAINYNKEVNDKMKTPKAKKLKSGNWNVQIQINGKRYSCTAGTKKEAQQKDYLQAHPKLFELFLMFPAAKKFCLSYMKRLTTL